MKARAWQDDCEILPLNPGMGPAGLGRNVGRWEKVTITACADFVGTFGRKGARLFARMELSGLTRGSLWTADIPGSIDVRGYRAQGWNARDSVELVSDAATPYVAVVIGQQFSAGAKQDQQP